MGMMNEGHLTQPSSGDLADATLKAEAYKAKGNEEYKKREFGIAIDFYTKGIEAKCKNEQLNAILYTNRATAHFYLGNYHDTLSDAKAAREQKPTYMKAMERGASACEKLCLYEEAITWCDAGLAIDKTNKKLLDLRTRCVSENDRSQSSAKETRESDLASHSSQTLDFDDATLRVIADVYKNEGNDEFRDKAFGNAIDFYTQGIEVKCKDEELNAILYTNRATAHFCLGNYHKALKDSKTARKLNPAYMRAIERGASACEKLCLFEEAAQWCNEGLSIDQKNKALLVLRTRSLRHEEKQRKAGEENVKNSLLMETAVGKKDGCKETVRKLHLPVAKEVGGSTKKQDPHSNLAALGYNLKNFNEYIDYHKSQLAYAKKRNNKEGEAIAYYNLGNAYQSVGDYKQAIVYYNLELAISKELGDRALEGSTYTNLGNAYELLSDFKQAINCHELQLNIAREMGSRSLEGRAYCHLGNVYQHLGDFRRAIDYHKLHLNISKEIGDKPGEGGAYGNLGNAYQSLGDFKEAKAHHELDLAMAKERGDRVGEGRALGNLGSAFKSLGDFRKAIYNQKLTLVIAKEVGDWRGEGRAYGNLGSVYRCLGDYEQAIYYHKLHRTFAKSLGDRAGEGYACGHLGSAFYCLGNFEEAVKYHEIQLAIAKDVEDRSGEGYAYGNLGICYQGLGDSEQAIYYYKLTLAITKEVRNKAGEGRIYGYLGNAYLTLHDLTQAIAFQKLRLAIAIEVEDMEEVAAAYHGLGLCFERQGTLTEAQDCYETSVRHLNGIRRLLQRHDGWKIGLRDVHQSAYISLWAILLKQNKPFEALRAAEQGRAQALIELMELQYGFGPSQSGREEKVDFSDLSFLTSSTIFLALGSSTLNTWVVTNGNRIHFSKEKVDKRDVTKSCQSFMESIKKATLAAAAKCEDRSLDALRDAICDLSVIEPLVETCPESESPEDHLQMLYDLIISPVADQLCGDEIIIVPDGPLFLAPYAAFVYFNPKYLCESYRIRVLPSLTSLKLITNAPPDYHCNSGALIVGNPCTKEIRNDKGEAFPSLPAAEKEAKMIGQILNTSPLIGSEATKAKVLERLNSVALIHIAAHGDIRTGEIALAPNPRRKSSIPSIPSIPKWEDFVLTMSDLLGLSLRARLVVLSCCHSGRGEIKAEGVVGIARAFLGAGARSVLVSLWAIDDEATQEFMTRFYQELVNGVRASKALNHAMKCLRESKRFSDVRYWAPFVLIGDDVTLKLGGAEN